MTHARPSESVHIAVVAPPAPLASTLHGVVEFFAHANRVATGRAFTTTVVAPAGTSVPPDSGPVYEFNAPPRRVFDALIVCPAYGAPAAAPIAPGLARFFDRQRRAGTRLSSVCAGAFVLGSAGILDGHRVTTHWALADELQLRCPRARVDADALLIEDGQVMTAAGTTAWVDLVLSLAARLGSPHLAAALGKFYLTDTAPREQRCYRVFNPKQDHGSPEVARAEAAIAARFRSPLTVSELAASAGMSVRNFQRRFKEATKCTPQSYLKRFRVQMACAELETSKRSVERVIGSVGYSDTSAFRKAFREITGLSPSAYRRRFRVE